MVKRIILTLFNRIFLVVLIGGGCSLEGGGLLTNNAEELEPEIAQNETESAALVRKSVHPVTGQARDYDPLLKMIGDARFVLLGEATHGTHEFYRERALITRRLIEEKGFDAVVLEADWTDAWRTNQYVKGRSEDRTAEESLEGFTRFPEWMWRNADFRDFVRSVRAYHEAGDAGKAGIYGMDLYGLAESTEAVIEYLNRIDPAAGSRAARRYACFDVFRSEPARYGAVVSRDAKKSCEKQAAEQFQEMEGRYNTWRQRSDRQPDEELFSAYQNARVVKNGEAYYRLSYQGNFSTWNLRDSHMAETIQALTGYLEAGGRPEPKIVVWAHNTHQGDARMTEMGEAGELNVGQLMRQAHDGGTVLVGFTTYAGEVTAASKWGEKGRKMKVLPALAGSYSRLFHDTGVPDFLLIFRGNEELSRELERPRPERAIGVVYLPETERRSHYFQARMARQFDAVIHFDQTSAVRALK